MDSEFISLAQASRMTGYHQDYLGQLARAGKLEAKKIGRNWLTTKKSINIFLGREAQEQKVEPATVQPEIKETKVELKPATVIEPEIKISKQESTRVSVNSIQNHPGAGVNVQESLIKFYPTRTGEKINAEQRNIIIRFGKIWEKQKIELEDQEENILQLRDEVKDLLEGYEARLRDRELRLREQEKISLKLLTRPTKKIKQVVSHHTISTHAPYAPALVSLLAVIALVLTMTGTVYFYKNTNTDFTATALDQKRVAGDSTTSLYMWPPSELEARSMPTTVNLELSNSGHEQVSAGQTEMIVINPHATPTSTIVITFKEEYQGGYWIAGQYKGSFVIKLTTPPVKDLPFDFWIGNLQVSET